MPSKVCVLPSATKPDAAAHLTEQRCDGVVAAVQDQQQRRNLRLPEVKQLVLLRDDLLTERGARVRRLNQRSGSQRMTGCCHGDLDALAEPLRHVRRQLVADHRTFLQSKQDGGQTLSAAGQHGGFPAAALKAWRSA